MHNRLWATSKDFLSKYHRQKGRHVLLPHHATTIPRSYSSKGFSITPFNTAAATSIFRWILPKEHKKTHIPKKEAPKTCQNKDCRDENIFTRWMNIKWAFEVAHKVKSRSRFGSIFALPHAEKGKYSLKRGSKSYIILIAQLVCYGLFGSCGLNISIGNIQSTFQTVCLILNGAMPQAMPIGQVASNALSPLHPIQCQLS